MTKNHETLQAIVLLSFDGWTYEVKIIKEYFIKYPIYKAVRLKLRFSKTTRMNKLFFFYRSLT